MIDVTHLVEGDIIIEIYGHSSLVGVVFEQDVKLITADECLGNKTATNF